MRSPFKKMYKSLSEEKYASDGLLNFLEEVAENPTKEFKVVKEMDDAEDSGQREAEIIKRLEEWVFEQERKSGDDWDIGSDFEYIEFTINGQQFAIYADGPADKGIVEIVDDKGDYQEIGSAKDAKELDELMQKYLNGPNEEDEGDIEENEESSNFEDALGRETIETPDETKKSSMYRKARRELQMPGGKEKFIEKLKAQIAAGTGKSVSEVEEDPELSDLLTELLKKAEEELGIGGSQRPVEEDDDEFDDEKYARDMAENPPKGMSNSEVNEYRKRAGMRGVDEEEIEEGESAGGSKVKAKIEPLTFDALPPAPSSGVEEYDKEGLNESFNFFLEGLQQEVSASEFQKGIIADPLDFSDKSRFSKPKGGYKKDDKVAERPQKLIHDSTIKGITKGDGEEWDLNELKDLIVKRPKVLMKQNEKMKASGLEGEVYYNINLPAYQGIWFDEGADEFKIVRVCPQAGACKAFCYAAKGGYIQYEPSVLSTTNILNFLLNHPEEFEDQLVSELKKWEAKVEKGKLKGFKFRWHDSGDFFNDSYIDLAFSVANKTPGIQHYAYTKAVNRIAKRGDVPENFKFLESTGGTQDKMLDREKGVSDVVMTDIFHDLDIIPGRGKEGNNPEDIETLKDRVAEDKGIDRETIITYPEMMEKISNDDKGFLSKNNYWNVLVWKGHGDDAATRKEVKDVLLLAH